MNIFKLRSLLALCMMQFILGPVEVTNLAGDRFEVIWGTVGQIRTEISRQLRIEEWSVILSQGTKILHDQTMAIADGEKLSLLVSRDAKSFIKWILGNRTNRETEFYVIFLQIESKITDNGPEFTVKIMDSMNNRHSANFPGGIAKLPLIDRVLPDNLSLMQLLDPALPVDERQNLKESLSEHYKDDARMLTMIKFINEELIKKPDNIMHVEYINSNVEELTCFLSLKQSLDFACIGQFIEILMGNSTE